MCCKGTRLDSGTGPDSVAYSVFFLRDNFGTRKAIHRASRAEKYKKEEETAIKLHIWKGSE